MYGADAVRILHVIDGLGLGGAERMAVDLANLASVDGHDVSLCVTRNETTLLSSVSSRVDVLVLDRRRRVSPLAALRLARWARRKQVDVIHVHLRSSLLFVLPLRASRLLRAAVVFHDHYGTIEVDTAIPAWFRFAHRYFEHYVGVYSKLEEWARSAGVPARKASTIANAMDLERLRAGTTARLREELGISPSRPLGVMVATVRRDKGIEVLLEAIVAANLQNQITVAIAGAFTDREYTARCKQLCTTLGLDDTVRFLGPRTDVPALLRAADFALLSSHTESGPLVLVEYIVAEKPFVSTLVGDIGRRLAAAGVDGFVPASDPVAFGRELKALLAEPDLTKRGRHGRSLINEFDLRVVMPRWYEVYRQAIASMP